MLVKTKMHYFKTTTAIMRIEKLIRNTNNNRTVQQTVKYTALTTFYAPELITLVSRFNPILRDLKAHPCLGRSIATKLKGQVGFPQVTIFLQ